jgi:hypothetical protein
MKQIDVDEALDMALNFRRKCAKHAEMLDKSASTRKHAKFWFSVMDRCDDLIEQLEAK